jgi:beta-N-acetylhexosaminidase
MKHNGRELRTTLLSLILFVIFGAGPVASVPTFFSESHGAGESRDELIDELIASMNETEMLGQIFLFGWFGSAPSDDILYWIREKKIGGVKVFGWNAGDVEQLADSIATMQRAASESRHEIPLLVATDQEGGWVRHIKSRTSITPGNMAIGATGLPYDAYWSGYYIGMELKTLGINMNFAPTVDVYTNTEAHVIGPRAFSHDPAQTARLAVAYYKGLEKAGVISTAKHFPGHGNTAEDSHGTLPEISTTLSELWDRELVPYRHLIRKELPAVMSGHLSFPSVIEEELPASLSPFFMTEILKKRMGFDGIVITDDMRMHAVAARQRNTARACFEAFMAGNDMIMVSRDSEVHRRVWNYFSDRLQSNPEFRARLEESVRRILRVKMRYLRREDAVPLYPDAENVKEKIPSEEAEEFFFDQACRSVSIIRNALLPLEKDRDNILIAGQLTRFLSIGKRYYPNADTLDIPYQPFYEAAEATVEDVRRRARNYDTVIFCLANPNGAQVLDALEDIPADVVVLSTLTPSYLSERPWVDTAIAVYGTGEESAVAGFACLRGMIEPRGEVPFPLYGEDRAVEGSGAAAGDHIGEGSGDAFEGEADEGAESGQRGDSREARRETTGMRDAVP